MKMGVDQSLNSSGIVIVNNNDTLIDFYIIKSDKQLKLYDRIEQITNDIVAIQNNYKPEKVNIEEIAYGANGNATRNLAGLLAHLVIQLKQNSNVKVIPPNSLKKQATGNGKAKKEQMVDNLPPTVKTVFEMAGFKKTTGLYDLADAYHLAVFK